MSTFVKSLLIALLFLAGLAGAVFWYKSHQKEAPLVPPVAQATYPVAILGDSLVEGVEASTPENNFANQLFAKIKEKQPNATLLNTGVSGATTADVLFDQLPKLDKQSFSLVILLVGTNDITHFTNRSVFASNYQKIVGQLDQPGRQILVLNIPKFANTPVIPSGLSGAADFTTRQFNNDIAETIKNHPQFHLFDFYTLSADKLQPGSTLLSADQFHPNDQGYAQLAQAVAAQILP